MLPIKNVCQFSLEVCKFSCVNASEKLFESTISKIIMCGGMNSYYDLWQQERCVHPRLNMWQNVHLFPVQRPLKILFIG
jgi:hypothetical protein